MSTLPKIIAVDFDGTLFENAWPDVGAPIEKNINKLKAEQADGAKVILWTNRVGGALDKAVNFCILDILDYRNWRDSFQILRTRKRMARMRIYFERRLPNDHCLYRRTAERQNHNAY